jgi:UDP-glucose 6-dehydrogenase
MARLGHDVVGVDVDEVKIKALTAGYAPLYEPGLTEALTETVATGRLRFTTDLAEIAGARVHFVCVGTPQRRGEFAADLTYVHVAFAALLPHVCDGDLVVGKSTVASRHAIATGRYFFASPNRSQPSTGAWTHRFQGPARRSPERRRSAR